MVTSTLLEIQQIPLKVTEMQHKMDSEERLINKPTKVLKINESQNVGLVKNQAISAENAKLKE